MTMIVTVVVHVCPKRAVVIHLISFKVAVKDSVRLTSIILLNPLMTSSIPK